MMDRFSKAARIVAATAALLIGGGSAASAFVLADPKADKDAIGNRNDIFAQSVKFSQCIVKAAQKCEKGQDPLTQQCAFTLNLSTPTTTFSGQDPKNKIAAKFEADVQKCIDKVNFEKKGAKGATSEDKYAAIGCPGDCDPVASDRQPCTNLSTYEDSSLIGTLGQVNLLAALVPTVTVVNPNPEEDPNGCVPPSADPMNEKKAYDKQLKAFDKCVTSAVAVVAKYAADLQKCAAACEADYKNKKGNGGPFDDAACNFGVSTDLNFLACAQKALAKAEKKKLPNGITGALALIGLALNDGTNNLFNQPDNCPL